MIDIYFREASDQNFKDDVFDVTDEIENTISQVRMTILTKKGEVLGEPNFGIDATKYLFEFEGYPIDLLEKEAAEQIQDFVMLSKIHQVYAQAFVLDDVSDVNRIGLGLDISIKGKRTFAALYED